MLGRGSQRVGAEPLGRAAERARATPASSCTPAQMSTGPHTSLRLSSLSVPTPLDTSANGGGAERRVGAKARSPRGDGMSPDDGRGRKSPRSAGGGIASSLASPSYAFSAGAPPAPAPAPALAPAPFSAAVSGKQKQRVRLCASLALSSG